MSAPRTRRELLAVAGLFSAASLSGCSLRLEDRFATDLGEKPSADLARLEKVRAIAEGITTSQLNPAAAKAQQAQLRRLSALIAALGGPSAAPKPSEPSSATPDAAAATRWLSPPALAALAPLNAANAPLAYAVAQLDLATALNASVTLPWPETVSLPTSTARDAARATDGCIHALEWLGSRSAGSYHDAIQRVMPLLTTARSTAQAVNNRAVGVPARSYASAADAQNVAKANARAVQAAGAHAGEIASTVPEAVGTLMTWVAGSRVLAILGEQPRAFDGLRRG